MTSDRAREYTDEDLINDIAMDFYDTHKETTMGEEAYRKYLETDFLLVPDEDCMKDYEAEKHIWIAIAKRAYWWFCE